MAHCLSTVPAADHGTGATRVLHPDRGRGCLGTERTESPEALLALVVDLKCFQKMARVGAREEIPQAVTDYVRRCLGWPQRPSPATGQHGPLSGTAARYASGRA